MADHTNRNLRPAAPLTGAPFQFREQFLSSFVSFPPLLLWNFRSTIIPLSLMREDNITWHWAKPLFVFSLHHQWVISFPGIWSYLTQQVGLSRFHGLVIIISLFIQEKIGHFLSHHFTALSIQYKSVTTRQQSQHVSHISKINSYIS